MPRTDLLILIGVVDEAVRHAGQALMRLENERRSDDPARREAYRAVQALIADLGGLRRRLERLSRRS